MKDDEQLDEFFKGINQFMENTNKILARLQMEVDNIKVDIHKLQKHSKNNGNLILKP